MGDDEEDRFVLSGIKDLHHRHVLHQGIGTVDDVLLSTTRWSTTTITTLALVKDLTTTEHRRSLTSVEEIQSFVEGSHSSSQTWVEVVSEEGLGPVFSAFHMHPVAQRLFLSSNHMVSHR